MQRVCLTCERSAPDQNLLCQERACPAERAPLLLEAGEWLGDIEVVRRLALLRAATLYAARQGGRAVLLKVAHPGAPAVERLKREARLLAELGPAGGPAAGLPEPLPPYPGTTTDANPYGRAIVDGQLLFFCVWRSFDGAPLRSILAERPQPWVYQTGWLVGELARTLAVLQNRNLVHHALCPEALLVRFDERTGAPKVLLIDLGVATARPELAQHWQPALVPPGYIAPELLDAPPPGSFATDVYGLGLLLFELLVGAPAFPQRLHSDAETLAAVRQGHDLRTGRAGDVREFAALAEQAVSRDPAARPASAAEVAHRLRVIVGAPPQARRIWLPSPRALIGIVLALLTLAFVLTVVANAVALAS